ncbi:MAG: hypothetical protein FJ213_06260 [Ignavibacteria bacterium]|nr:hypothetical protein [Ignavibacteria bacterium]
MKPLFKNYNFEFNSTEKKLLSTLVKQILKQIEGDSRYSSEIRIYQSLSEKFSSSQEVVKLTKEESKRIETQLTENLKQYKDAIKKSWFFKKWMYKSLINQYEGLLNNHFKKR